MLIIFMITAPHGVCDEALFNRIPNIKKNIKITRFSV